MLGTIVRFLISAAVLLVISYFIPGISVNGFMGALIAAVVIAALGYLVETLLGDKVSPQARGITGFVSAAVVIYAAQLIAPNQISVSIWGALLAAFVIGLVDSFVPTELR